MNKSVLAGLIIVIAVLAILLVAAYFGSGRTVAPTTTLLANQSAVNSSAPSVPGYTLVSSTPPSNVSPLYLRNGLVGGEGFIFSNGTKSLLIRVLTYNDTAQASLQYANVTAYGASSSYGAGANLTQLNSLPNSTRGVYLSTPAQKLYSLSSLFGNSVVTVTLKLPPNANLPQQNAVALLLSTLNATYAKLGASR